MLPPAYEPQATTDVSGLDQCMGRNSYYTDPETGLPEIQVTVSGGDRE